MASPAYEEILERLPQLQPAELWLLLGQLQAQLKTRPKHRLNDFRSDAADHPAEDWVRDLRAEWER